MIDLKSEIRYVVSRAMEKAFDDNIYGGGVYTEDLEDGELDRVVDVIMDLVEKDKAEKEE